jgi:ectoine hydroxylase-related dioxygenase (phytanoyl-CoA dioxygenase family)
MGIVPGSHRGELFDLQGDDGGFAGSIRPSDLGRANTDTAVYLKGPAGSATVHNCCAVHGSAPNTSSLMRPLLLQTYSRADSYPLLGVGTNGKAGNSAHTLVRGSAPDRITINGRTMHAAPDWYKGTYTSIFAHQQGADS